MGVHTCRNSLQRRFEMVLLILRVGNPINLLFFAADFFFNTEFGGSYVDLSVITFKALVYEDRNLIVREISAQKD